MQFIDEWLVPSLNELVPSSELEALRAADAARPVSLWDVLVARGLATDDQIMAAAAARYRVRVADLGELDDSVRDAVPEQLVRRLGVLPLRMTESYLEVATANPFDIDAEKVLAFATRRAVRMLLSPPAVIREKLRELYHVEPDPSQTESEMYRLLGGIDEERALELLEADEGPEDLKVSADEASQRPVVRLVDLILSDGITCGASDIHIESAEKTVIVRYRIDGVLRQVMKIPRAAGLPLISRIKIISGLDIADRLRPQDGRARVAVSGAPVDLRISTLPASMGEKVVIRILNAQATVLSLEALGLSDEERKAITSLLYNKEGIILVTGPTGSGKTTTLYSAIRLIQSEGVNIVTVEDPVEYRLGQNIVQVQVNEKAGLTFAAALRSILRQDPDVVLVGEIRDKETATIALQSSLTGHLVLSTLHTNDAPTAVTRLVDIGMEAYKIASALRGVVAQRLMRRVCKVCQEPFSDPLPANLRRFIPAGTKLVKAVGCPDCAMTGYRGRFCIVQIMTMSPDLERRIGAGEQANQIAAAAQSQGMRSLFESGLPHVLSGETTIDELLRVVDVPEQAEGGESKQRPSRQRVSEPPRPQARPMGKRTSAPAAVEDVTDLSAEFELLEHAAPDDGEVETTQVERATVLLVDDEDQLRRVMRDLLERDGFVVTEARDGVQALDQVDRHAPDIIVLDLNLPGLDGYTVLSQLRSRPATQHIPVIVLTAKGDEDNEVRVFELGADDFLTKPFRARALSARLDAVLNRRHRA